MTTAMTWESRAMRKHSPRAARLRLAPRGQDWLVCLQQGNHPSVWVGLYVGLVIHDPVCCSCEGTQAQASTVWAGLDACLVIHNQVCCSCDETYDRASTGQCMGLSLMGRMPVQHAAG